MESDPANEYAVSGQRIRLQLVIIVHNPKRYTISKFFFWVKHICAYVNDNRITWFGWQGRKLSRPLDSNYSFSKLWATYWCRSANLLSFARTVKSLFKYTVIILLHEFTRLTKAAEWQDQHQLLCLTFSFQLRICMPIILFVLHNTFIKEILQLYISPVECLIKHCGCYLNQVGTAFN
jgi:hypothetical protein